MSDEKKPVDGDVEPPESKRDWAEYPDRVKRRTDLSALDRKDSSAP